MSAIDRLFKQLKQKKRKAFMPFLTAGDPDLATTSELLKALVEHGSSMCEVGIPYSDPIADGPVIQASYTRALDRGLVVDEILEMLKGTCANLAAPVVTMVSYAIIHRIGLEKYVEQARNAGVAGAIVPDLLVEEAGPLAKVCRQADFSLIQLVTPTTPRERAVRVAESSTGFLYYVSVTGITGERTQLPPELVDNVGWLREQTPLPICIGFGISGPEHVKMLAPVADGLIVGSAIVRRIADSSDKGAEVVRQRVCELVDDLIAAMT